MGKHVDLPPELNGIFEEYKRVEGCDLDLEKLILEGICLEYLGVLSTSH